MTNEPLINLAIKYFKKIGYKVEQNIAFEGFSGVERKFDLLVQKENEKRLIIVKDWKRTVGVNAIINLDKAAEDVDIPNPVMISEKFSGHAKAYARRRGIILLTKYEILKRLS